ncbi:Homologous-pairing protein 2 like protein [Chelonia mydas]|uniref:Homologous-pairing protein 2 like protein n=1 Tax=Chelonia mydas TaxID=8469 RepID=M7BTH7_CHEMY|nr:Homologous-pairing protein 2 like protein [Chelonia mydas]
MAHFVLGLCDIAQSEAVVKALEQLAQQGKIREKAYGKQKIYFPDQDQFPTVSDSEFKALDNEISELSSKVQTLQQSCRHMESELKDLNGSMTTPEMIKEIEDLKKDCASYTEKLERIKSAANHVTPEEKEKATELLDAILEGYPKSKKQFFGLYAAFGPTGTLNAGFVEVLCFIKSKTNRNISLIKWKKQFKHYAPASVFERQAASTEKLPYPN